MLVGKRRIWKNFKGKRSDESFEMDNLPDQFEGDKRYLLISHTSFELIEK